MPTPGPYINWETDGEYTCLGVDVHEGGGEGVTVWTCDECDRVTVAVNRGEVTEVVGLVTNEVDFTETGAAPFALVSVPSCCVL